MARVATRLSDSGSTVNLGTGITGPTVMFNLKECLKQAGWTHWASGDGSANFSTTPGNVNDVITSAGAGANGYDNNNAWWIGRDPGSNYQVLIQRGTGNRSWRVFFTRSGVTFTGGTPSATVPPTIPSDALQAVGVSLAYATAYFPATATWKAHCIAENAAVNGVYGFWMFTHESVFDTRNALFYEPMIVGSHPTPVEEPFAAYAVNDGPGALLLSKVCATNWSCYYRQGANRIAEMGTISGTTFFNTGGNLPSTMPVNPYDGTTEDHFRVWIAIEPPCVSKGFTSGIRLKATTKNYPDTVDNAGNGWVFAGGLLVPWPTGVTPT